MIPQHLSKTNEHYTPAYIVEAARSLMGGIDLDPASCAKANETIKATNTIGLPNDGLAIDWFGKVFLNPPGGKLKEFPTFGTFKRWVPIKDGPGESSMAVWWDRLACDYEQGKIEQGFFVAFNLEILRTSQAWDYPVQRYFRCYPSERIRFGGASSPTHANLLVWLPPKQVREDANGRSDFQIFCDHFIEIGLCETGSSELP